MECFSGKNTTYGTIFRNRVVQPLFGEHFISVDVRILGSPEEIFSSSQDRTLPVTQSFCGGLAIARAFEQGQIYVLPHQS